jgi:integral membrane sensor domain MASE1
MRFRLTPFRPSQTRRCAWLPAALMAAYVATAIIAYKWTTIPGGLAVFWPNNGLVAAALLLCSAPAGLAVAGVGLLADTLGARFIEGTPWSQAALIGGLDFCEAWLAAVLIRRIGGAALDLTRVRRFGDVILGGVLPATFLAGTIGSVAVHAIYGAPLRALWINWAVNDFLGMSVGAPAALTIARFRRFDRPKLRSPLTSLGWLFMLSALAVVPFWLPGR